MTRVRADGPDVALLRVEPQGEKARLLHPKGVVEVFLELARFTIMRPLKADHHLPLFFPWLPREIILEMRCQQQYATDLIRSAGFTIIL